MIEVVKEKSSRDSYQNLKTAVIARLSKERGNTYRNLSRSVLPLLAVALPAGGSDRSSGGGGLWESNVGFFLGTHPPPPQSSAALPTLKETNIDEDGDIGCSNSCVAADQRRSASASWTAADLPPSSRTGHRPKIGSTKSGSLDATTRLLLPRNGPQRGSSNLLLTAANSHSSRWPPRKVQSEITIDPTLLGDSVTGGGGRGTLGVQLRPVCVDFKGVSFDNRPETETMSLEDGNVIDVDASPMILPRDVSVAQNG